MPGRGLMKPPTRVALPSGASIPRACRRNESKYWVSEVATNITETRYCWLQISIDNSFLQLHFTGKFQKPICNYLFSHLYTSCSSCTDQSQSESGKEGSSASLSWEYQRDQCHPHHHHWQCWSSPQSASSRSCRPAPECCRRTGCTCRTKLCIFCCTGKCFRYRLFGFGWLVNDNF